MELSFPVPAGISGAPLVHVGDSGGGLLHVGNLVGGIVGVCLASHTSRVLLFEEETEGDGARAP